MKTLEKELEDISKEAETKRELALRKSEFFKRLDTNGIVVYPQVPNPSPKKWKIILPKVYEGGNMIYTPEQHHELSREVTSANKKIDEFVQRHFDEIRNFVNEKPEEAVPGWWEPVSISWNTFALPNFMNDPILGKYASLPCKGHFKLPFSAYISFNMFDIGRGIKPFYFMEIFKSCTGPGSTPVFDAIKKEMKAMNPKGYEFVSRKYKESSFVGIVETG